MRGAWAGLGEASWLTPFFLLELLGSSQQPCSDVPAMMQVVIRHADSLEGAGEEGGMASGGFQGC